MWRLRRRQSAKHQPAVAVAERAAPRGPPIRASRTCASGSSGFRLQPRRPRAARPSGNCCAALNLAGIRLVEISAGGARVRRTGHLRLPEAAACPRSPAPSVTAGLVRAGDPARRLPARARARPARCGAARWRPRSTVRSTSASGWRRASRPPAGYYEEFEPHPRLRPSRTAAAGSSRAAVCSPPTPRCSASR